MVDQNGYWPYILLMPIQHKERTEFIKDVLASRIASSVLPKFEESDTVLQKDLIDDLSHSNKSIIRYLEILRHYGLIETGSRVENGKRVVFHKPTKQGWELVRFFSEGLPLDISKITETLLEDYLTSLLTFYREHNLNESIFFEILMKVRTKAMLEGSTKYSNPDFLIVGASALFTNIECDTIGTENSEIGCRIPTRYTGGPTIDLTIELAKENEKVAFVSSIGDDLNGWNVISTLIPKKIDVSYFVVDTERRTNETILLSDGSTYRTFVGIDEGFSLSITSPSQVPWNILEHSQIVYLGEVFLEVAFSIATFCKAKHIPVIFRCSPHFWKLGMTRISSLLDQIDVLLVSPNEWEIAKNELGSNPFASLLKHTKAEILVKTGPDKFGLLTKDSDTMKFLTYPNPSSDLDANLVARLLRFYKNLRQLGPSFNRCFE